MDERLLKSANEHPNVLSWVGELKELPTFGRRAGAEGDVEERKEMGQVCAYEGRGSSMRLTRINGRPALCRTLSGLV